MSPPFLIQHGSADTEVPPDQSQKLNDALKAQSVPTEILIYPGAGQDFSKDGTVDATTSAKAIADMEDFITRTFPPPKPETAAAKSSKPARAAKAKTTKARR
jgi:dipeptidyl aminopeptidase/acylaminoacyl peptidase